LLNEVERHLREVTAEMKGFCPDFAPALVASSQRALVADNEIYMDFSAMERFVTFSETTES
jgi:hypothetical protein